MPSDALGDEPESIDSEQAATPPACLSRRVSIVSRLRRPRRSAGECR